MTPETRAAFLDSLGFGLSIARALSGAHGGRIPVKAWCELGEMRNEAGAAYDADVAAACKAAEKREAEKKNEVQVPAAEVARTATGAEQTSANDGAHVGANVASVLATPVVGEVFNRYAKEYETPSATAAPVKATEPAAPSVVARIVTAAKTLWSEAATASAIDTPEPVIQDAATGWDRVRREALAMGATSDPELYRYLLWVERRAIAAGMHALDPAWKRHFRAFYASGKFVDVGRFGVRAAKSDSTMYAIVGEVVLMQRVLQPNIVGTCPVFSANMKEAGDRFETAKPLLRAMGFNEIPKGSREEVGTASYKVSGGGNAALVIELLDSQEHPVRFQVCAASEYAAAGFTGIGGFADEVDLWGKADGANPASKVFRVLRSRYTTQPEAKLHIMSATYDRASEHAAIVARGDTQGQYVARIGAEGSAIDFEHRMRLAHAIESKDMMLCGPALPPDCTDIPCWVTNPITPIEEAYAKADGDLRIMFGLFGGRLEAAGSADMSAQCVLAARMTAALSAQLNGRTVQRNPNFVEPMKVAGARHGDSRYDGKTIARAPQRVDWRKRKVL